MKAEDVRLLWRIASLEACGVESGYDPPEELLIRFARACEQHGIARTKAHAGPHVYPELAPTQVRPLSAP